MKNKLFITLVLLCLLTTVFNIYDNAGAAPLATTYGPTPLYDSDWVACSGDGETQTFSHGLDAWPTLWTVYAANDDEGQYPTESPTNFYFSSEWFGHLPAGTNYDTLKVLWRERIGYHATGGWHYADSDYVRVVIWAADDGFGPIRP